MADCLPTLQATLLIALITSNSPSLFIYACSPSLALPIFA